MSKFMLSAGLILASLAGFSGAVQAYRTSDSCNGRQLVASFDCSSEAVADAKMDEGAGTYCCVEIDNQDTTWSVYWYKK